MHASQEHDQQPSTMRPCMPQPQPAQAGPTATKTTSPPTPHQPCGRVAVLGSRARDRRGPTSAVDGGVRVLVRCPGRATGRSDCVVARHTPTASPHTLSDPHRNVHVLVLSLLVLAGLPARPSGFFLCNTETYTPSLAHALVGSYTPMTRWCPPGRAELAAIMAMFGLLSTLNGR